MSSPSTPRQTSSIGPPQTILLVHVELAFKTTAVFSAHLSLVKLVAFLVPLCHPPLQLHPALQHLAGMDLYLNLFTSAVQLFRLENKSVGMYLLCSLFNHLYILSSDTNKYDSVLTLLRATPLDVFNERPLSVTAFQQAWKHRLFSLRCWIFSTCVHGNWIR